MIIGEEHADASASKTTGEPSRSPVFVDDSGRRLLRVRVAAWFGSTAGMLFLGAVGVSVLIGSVGGPADWNFPFAPQPLVKQTPPGSVVRPSSPSTIEALIILPPRFSAGPDQDSTSVVGSAVSATGRAGTPLTTSPAKPITLPVTSSDEATGKPTVLPAAPKDRTTPKPTPPQETSSGKATGKPTVLPAAPKGQNTRKPTAPPASSAAETTRKPIAPPGLTDAKATGKHSAPPGRAA